MAITNDSNPWELNSTAQFDNGVDVDSNSMTCITLEEYYAFMTPEINQSTVDPTESTTIRVAMLLVYGFLFVFGLMANLGVIVAIVRHKRMRRTRNMFLLNLMVSNVVLCFSVMPITPTLLVVKKWIFGEFVCWTSGFAQSTAVIVSIWSLTALVVDKYVHVVNITRQATSFRSTCAVTVAIWIGAAVYSYPLYRFSRLLDMNEPVEIEDLFTNETINLTICDCQCAELWPSCVTNSTNSTDDGLCPWYLSQGGGFSLRQLYGYSFVTVQMIVPAIVIVFCYTKLFIRIRRDMSGGSHALTKSLTPQHRRKAGQRKRKVQLISMGVVFAFILGWLPIVLKNLMTDLQINISQHHRITINLICHFNAMTTVVTVPILVHWLTHTKKSQAQRQRQKRKQLDRRRPELRDGTSRGTPRSTFRSYRQPSINTMHSARTGLTAYHTNQNLTTHGSSPQLANGSSGRTPLLNLRRLPTTSTEYDLSTIYSVGTLTGTNSVSVNTHSANNHHNQRLVFTNETVYGSVLPVFWWDLKMVYRVNGLRKGIINNNDMRKLTIMNNKKSNVGQMHV